MLRFINQHGFGVAKSECLLNGVAILGSGTAGACLRERTRRAIAVARRQALIIHQRLLDLVKHPPEMIAPIEIAGFGRHSVHAHDRDCRAIRREIPGHFLDKNLFDPGAQGGVGAQGAGGAQGAAGCRRRRIRCPGLRVPLPRSRSVALSAFGRIGSRHPGLFTIATYSTVSVL